MNSKANDLKAVVFDLDGTLLDTLPDLHSAVNHALRETGFPERTYDEVRMFIGNGILKLIERSVPEGTKSEDISETLRLFKEYYGAHIDSKTAAYDGVAEMLAELKAAGVKTAVVSNKHNEAVKKLIDSFFGGLIDFTQGKTDGVPAKPDPTPLNTALNKLNVRKEDALYVGDSDVDVHTAHNAGVLCAAASWGYRSRESLKKAGADFIIDRADEILEIIFKNNK